MRSYLPDYPVINPTSLDEALEVLAAKSNIKPLAGGTDIMVYMDTGVFPASTLLNLYSIQDFSKTPEFSDGHLKLNPLSTYQHARTDQAIVNAFPLLAIAAKEISVLAVQSRATWIGNVANASPAADGVPALMAYDAMLKLSSKDGQREVPLHQFYQGYKQMDLQPNELITEIQLPPLDPGWKDYYRKVGTRRFQAISKTLLAGRIKLNEGRVIEDIRLVFASVAPYTLRAVQTESVLRSRPLTPEIIDEAAQAIQDEISPIDDIRSTETYRRQVTTNLIRDFLNSNLTK